MTFYEQEAHYSVRASYLSTPLPLQLVGATTFPHSMQKSLFRLPRPPFGSECWHARTGAENTNFFRPLLVQ